MFGIAQSPLLIAVVRNAVAWALVQGTLLKFPPNVLACIWLCPRRPLPLAVCGAAIAGLSTGCCQWPCPQGAEPGFWDVRQYQYWDARRGNWTDTQPAACIVRGMSSPTHWKWRNGSPRTAAHCNDKYCIYDNLW